MREGYKTGVEEANQLVTTFAKSDEIIATMISWSVSGITLQ
ncbi:hypothetical protein [Thermoflavimicrobium daqui]|jgi:hypothetical protein|nr:hypothetical protein [Thermoflavimicrobium daqui]